MLRPELLNPKIEFLFYAVAVVCWVLAAFEAAGWKPLRRIAPGLLPLGLAFAFLPWAFIAFKAGFHPEPFFGD